MLLMLAFGRDFESEDEFMSRDLGVTSMTRNVRHVGENSFNLST